MFGGVRKGLQALYWQSWSVKKQKRSWSSLFEQASCQDPLRKRVKGFSDGWNRAGEERYQLDGKETRLTVQTVVQLLPILWAFLWHLYWILLDSLAALALKFLWSCEKKSHFSPILSLPLIFFFFQLCFPLHLKYRGQIIVKIWSLWCDYGIRRWLMGRLGMVRCKSVLEHVHWLFYSSSVISQGSWMRKAHEEINKEKNPKHGEEKSRAWIQDGHAIFK